MKKTSKGIISIALGAALVFTSVAMSVFAFEVASAETADVEENANTAADVQLEQDMNSAETTGAAASVEMVELSDIDMSEAVDIHVQDGQISVTQDDEILTDSKAKDAGVTFENGVLSIKGAGTYVLSGKLDGNIQVSGKNAELVTLVLDGIEVNSENDEALTVKKTDKLIIYINEGTQNSFASGNESIIDQNTADDEAETEAADTQVKAQEAAEEMVPSGQTEIDEANISRDGDATEETEATDEAVSDPSGAAIHLKADAVIAGEGTLAVSGYINNGIQSSKSLYVQSGNITVNAENNGIKVKEDFVLDGGSIFIVSGGDGVKAQRLAQDATEEVLDETTQEVLEEAQEAQEAAGRICINDGSLDIDSYGDGIQAYLDLTVNGGNITIKTEGEYPEHSEWGDFGPGGSRNNAQTETVSEKGLKSSGAITINGGTIIIDSVDDSVHCAGLLAINDGDLAISTGDDGLHSDAQIIINGGNIDILTSYEGIEANQITVNDGDIYLVATDDGFNANGGSQSFGGPGGRQSQSKTATDMPDFNINGGTIYVNAAGDGLDSNGNITVAGGYTVVDGPENSWNGALDAGTENGGKISISDGTVFAGGASGMAETFGSTSEQCSFRCTFAYTYYAGTEIKISGTDGTVYFEHTTQSSGNCIVFSCPQLQVGDTCVLNIADYEFELELTSISTTFSISSDGTIKTGSNQGGSSGGPGGRR